MTPFLRTGDPITDSMITAAIRADLVVTILDPALNSPDAVVIEDRGIHTMASYALASMHTDPTIDPEAALIWLDALTRLVGPRPATALWLRVPPTLAARRAEQRHHRTGPSAAPAFTDEQRAHLGRVDHAYGLLSRRDPSLTTIDATDRDAISTHHAVHRALAAAPTADPVDCVLAPPPGHTPPPGPPGPGNDHAQETPR